MVQKLNLKIRSGVFLLKRLNAKIKQLFHFYVTAALYLCILISLSACKTAIPVYEKVDVLSLLDNKSSFYLRIPTSVDSEQFEKILQAKVKGLSEANARRITERIDTIYIGLERTKKGTEYQLAASCNFPKVVVKSAFSKGNGWNSDSLVLDANDGKKSKYEIYERMGTLASFPDTFTACTGYNLPSMIEKYHNIVTSQADKNESLNNNVYDWLCYDNGMPDDNIKFFATRPQAFLSMLVGAQLNYQLNYVCGSICNDPKNNNQFIMEIQFDFINRRIIPAARGALTLALGLTDAQVSSSTETNLTISNIKLNKKQLYQLLLL